MSVLMCFCTNIMLKLIAVTQLCQLPSDLLCTSASLHAPAALARKVQFISTCIHSNIKTKPASLYHSCYSINQMNCTISKYEV